MVLLATPLSTHDHNSLVATRNMLNDVLEEKYGPKFTLEISARSTGKTARAVQKAIEHLRQGFDIVFYTHSFREAGRITKMLATADISTGSQAYIIPYKDRCALYGVILKKPLYIYDEFDHFDDLPYFEPNAFAVTTPGYVRQTWQQFDPLYRALAIAKGIYSNYYWYLNPSFDNMDLGPNEVFGHMVGPCTEKLAFAFGDRFEVRDRMSKISL